MTPVKNAHSLRKLRHCGIRSKRHPAETNVTKSNPSKRHRLRLNAELDRLANLLPYEASVLTKLDRLSTLRLAVAYLRTKTYLQVSMALRRRENEADSTAECATDSSVLQRNREIFLQALEGFIIILDCRGKVFFSTRNIETYLGVHQSDVVHRSVFELVHSEDRDEMRRQLIWNGLLSPERANIAMQHVLQPENSHLLERSFTARFRCLLDNTFGFLRMSVRGRVRALVGQSRRSEEPALALFALCRPTAYASPLLSIPQKQGVFRSRHRLDLSVLSIDARGRTLLGCKDGEAAGRSFYDLVHQDDLSYMAGAHQELLRSGAAELAVYRLQTCQLDWLWLQTVSRVVHRNSRPDGVVSTHRALTEMEGQDLLSKRAQDFRTIYLGAELNHSQCVQRAFKLRRSQPRMTRKHRTQLKDCLVNVDRTKCRLACAGLPPGTDRGAVVYSAYSEIHHPPAPSACLRPSLYPTPAALAVDSVYCLLPPAQSGQLVPAVYHYPQVVYPPPTLVTSLQAHQHSLSNITAPQPSHSLGHNYQQQPTKHELLQNGQGCPGGRRLDQEQQTPGHQPVAWGPDSDGHLQLRCEPEQNRNQRPHAQLDSEGYQHLRFELDSDGCRQPWYEPDSGRYQQLRHEPGSVPSSVRQTILVRANVLSHDPVRHRDESHAVFAPGDVSHRMEVARSLSISGQPPVPHLRVSPIQSYPQQNRQTAHSPATDWKPSDLSSQLYLQETHHPSQSPRGQVSDSEQGAASQAASRSLHTTDQSSPLATEAKHGRAGALHVWTPYSVTCRTGR